MFLFSGSRKPFTMLARCYLANKRSVKDFTDRQVSKFCNKTNWIRTLVLHFCFTDSVQRFQYKNVLIDWPGTNQWGSHSALSSWAVGWLQRNRIKSWVIPHREVGETMSSSCGRWSLWEGYRLEYINKGRLIKETGLCGLSLGCPIKPTSRSMTSFHLCNISGQSQALTRLEKESATPQRGGETGKSFDLISLRPNNRSLYSMLIHLLLLH